MTAIIAIVCFFLGVVVGILTTSLAVVSGREDREREEQSLDDEFHEEWEKLRK